MLDLNVGDVDSYDRHELHGGLEHTVAPEVLTANRVD